MMTIMSCKTVLVANVRNSMESRQVLFIKDDSFIENYNSKYRVMVYKPADKKKAVKLVKGWLDMVGMQDVSINELYLKENNIDSNQKNMWVFGLTIPGYMRMSSMADNALDNLVGITKRNRSMSQ